MSQKQQPVNTKRFASQPGSLVRRTAILVEVDDSCLEMGFPSLGFVKMTLICDVRPSSISPASPARNRYVLEAMFNLTPDGRLVLGDQGGVLDRRMLSSPYRVHYTKDENARRLYYEPGRGFYANDPSSGKDAIEAAFRVDDLNTRYRTKAGSREDPEFQAIRSKHFTVWNSDHDLIRRITKLEAMLDHPEQVHRRYLSIRDLLPPIYASGVQKIEFDRSEIDAKITKILADPKADLPGSRSPLGTVRAEVLTYEDKVSKQFIRCYKADESYIDIPADGRFFRPTFEESTVLDPLHPKILFTFAHQRPMDINTMTTYEGAEVVLDQWFSLLSSHESVEINGNSAINYRLLTADALAGSSLFVAGTGVRELACGMLVDEPTRLVTLILGGGTVIRPDTSSLLTGQSGAFEWDLRFFETMLTPTQRKDLRQAREEEEMRELGRPLFRRRDEHGDVTGNVPQPRPVVKPDVNGNVDEAALQHAGIVIGVSNDEGVHVEETPPVGLPHGSVMVSDEADHAPID